LVAACEGWLEHKNDRIPYSMFDVGRSAFDVFGYVSSSVCSVVEKEKINGRLARF